SGDRPAGNHERHHQHCRRVARVQRPRSHQPHHRVQGWRMFPNAVRTHAIVLAASLGTLPLLGAGCAQTPPAATMSRTDAPTGIDPNNDPVNRYVASTTVDGLLVSVTIDGAKIELAGAQVARIPKPRPSVFDNGRDTVRLTLLQAGTAIYTLVVR